FLKDHEHLSYPESLRWLANRYQIEIEETHTTDEQKAAQDHRESLMIVNRYAADFFISSMNQTDEGKAIALGYFRERGLLETTIEKFELGWCPFSPYNKKESEPDISFTDHALNQGYKLEFLEELGLTRTKDKGSDHEKSYDFYRERVMFPIHNLSGKVIGFGGRTLKKEKKVPKYVNSPESLIYSKSKVLYGIYQSKRSIISEESCLLVEGYTDVISLHQAGISNVVASSGTALTPDQISLIKRYTLNVTVLYDGDAAGIKAATRGTELILEQGMNVRIVLLPDEEDPDSAVQKMGAEGFRKFISENAKDFVLFKTNLLLEESKGDPIKKAALIREIVQTISKVPDTLTRSLYIKETAALMQVDEAVLIQEVNQIKRKSFKKSGFQNHQDQRGPYPSGSNKQRGNAAPPPDYPYLDNTFGGNSENQDLNLIQPPVSNDGALDIDAQNLKNQQYTRELDLIRALFENDGYHVDKVLAVVKLVKEVDNIELEHHIFARILNEYREGLSKIEIPTINNFLFHDDEEIRTVVINIIQKNWEISPNWLKKHKVHITDKKFLVEDDIKKTGAMFRYRKSDAIRADLLKQIKEAEEVKDHATVKKCQELMIVLQKYRNDQVNGVNHYYVNKINKYTTPSALNKNIDKVEESFESRLKNPNPSSQDYISKIPEDSPPPPDMPIDDSFGQAENESNLDPEIY
ncbi:MAG: DNA primase, partial [Limisphaerales bacterium]